MSGAVGTGGGLGRAAPALTSLQEGCTAKPCPAGRVCRGTALGVQAGPSPGPPGAARMLQAKAPASRSENGPRVGEKLKRSGIWEKPQSKE